MKVLKNRVLVRIDGDKGLIKLVELKKRGDSLTGTVEAVGPDAHELQVGDRVLLPGYDFTGLDIKENLLNIGEDEIIGVL